MTALMGSGGTGQAGRPTWWASLAVRLASLPLPSEDRWRYRQEFLAELYGMTPAEQRDHAAGVLSRVWTLRIALTEPERLLVQEATMTKPWRCRLHLHRWRLERGLSGAAVPRVHTLRRHQRPLDATTGRRVRWLLDGQGRQRGVRAGDGCAARDSNPEPLP